MNIPQEINQSLESKLITSETEAQRFREQCLFLKSKLKTMDLSINRARAEAKMNEEALNKFKETNRELSLERPVHEADCKKWEQFSSTYGARRESLKQFGIKFFRFIKIVETRVLQLEENVKKLSDDLQLFKNNPQFEIDSSSGDAFIKDLLEHILAELIDKSKTMSGRTFLEANIRNDACRRLLDFWGCLRTPIKQALSSVAEIKVLERDIKRLKIKLQRAEAEV